MDLRNVDDNYEHISSDVMYVTNNIPGPGIDLDQFESLFATGCGCEKTCSETGTCSCTRNKKNYVFDQLVNDDDMIVECNVKCSCNNYCGNRLVQYGPLDCLIIKENNKGMGLFTSGVIKRGQFICEYAGEVIGVEEAKKRVEFNRLKKLMNFVLVVNEYIGNDKKITTCIDPSKFGNIGRYANHSCEPNSKLLPVRVENTIPHLCIFALRDIESGEEVTFNYAGSDVVDQSVQNFSDTKCLCNSKTCLGYLPHIKY